MLIDVRWPMGLLFSGLGIVLIIAGMLDPEPVTNMGRSVGSNVNLHWGLGMLLFGVLNLLLAFLKRAKLAHSHVRQPSTAEPEEDGKASGPSLLILLLCVVTAGAGAQTSGGVSVVPLKVQEGAWGVAVTNAGLASVRRASPVEIEFWSPAGGISSVFAAYREVVPEKNGFTGKATLSGPEGSRFLVQDHWRQEGDAVRLSRKVSVRGASASGFMSGFQFDLVTPRSWTDAEWFAPGMIYGGFEHLTAEAIGGKAHYKPGNYTVRIREDRMPAPVLMAHFADNSSLAVLNANPDGRTTTAEGAEVQPRALMDPRFQFGAVGGQERTDTLSVGYWFPGSEGEVTYAGNTYPGGQLHGWRRRYHPVRGGAVQEYEIQFRFGRGEPFASQMSEAWRWAWSELHPEVVKHDIGVARRVLTDMLAANVIRKDGRSGIPLFIDGVTGDMSKADRRAVMGFCGKNLEAVNYFLMEADLDHGKRGESFRQAAEAIAASFVKMKMAPPEGEGFYLDTGIATCARRKEEMMYLRCFGDDMKMLLRAYAREKQLGREHPGWLRWCREFADWLLPQQQPDGGFPRSWRLGTAQIGSASPNSSFNVVPMMVLLTETTGESKYLQAGIRAADFCWNNGQSRGRFVGGTIDNPDVLDKEAATISLEGYLALYESTREAKWLARAKGAADYAETWIYLWDVPMPDDVPAPNRHWKPGVPTAGVQLIATGHSLVDEYMCFDADDFAKLYKFTGDKHYYDVARILLHNTKSMLAVPGRVYDLVGPGWQQEHWSMAPRRGFGLHRGWLPWVSTSHLNGIFGLMNFDKELFQQLSRAEDPKAE